MTAAGPFVVMLIEDDPTMRSLLKTLLEIENFEVILTEDVNEQSVLETIQTRRPGAVLMDVYLRFYNGLDLLQSLRSQPETQNLPIMMTSGMDVRDKCLSLGASGFLMTPYMPDDLIDWLKQQQQV